MTWQELADKIALMSPEEREKDVWFLSCEQNGEAHPVDIVQAEEDQTKAWGDYAEDETANEIVVSAGEYYSTKSPFSFRHCPFP